MVAEFLKSVFCFYFFLRDPLTLCLPLTCPPTPTPKPPIKKRTSICRSCGHHQGSLLSWLLKASNHYCGCVFVLLNTMKV